MNDSDIVTRVARQIIIISYYYVIHILNKLGHFILYLIFTSVETSSSIKNYFERKKEI